MKKLKRGDNKDVRENERSKERLEGIIERT